MKAIEILGTVEEARCVRLDEPLPRQGEGFEFLNAPEEDRYTLRDGKPFDDAR